MTIRFHRLFEKRYKKLSLPLQQKVDATIRVFASNPFSSRLRNHALVGSLQGKRSLDVTGDVRIIFEVDGDYVVVLFLDVGTHARLYG